MPDLTTHPKEPKPPVPCRLYVVLARETPVGVIFRRGPSKWVQIIHWDTDRDTFTPGQWFHGRIYEKRSDISPNGKLLIYVTMKPSARTRHDSEYTDSWTAISKPPYLTALALWPCRSSVGGGLFLSNTEVWLNHYGRAEPHPTHLPRGLKVGTRGQDVLEEDMRHYRLERDGWRHIQEWQGEFIKSAWGKAYQERKQTGQPTDFDWHRSVDDLNTDSRYVTYAPSIHEKPHPTQGLTLVMMATLIGFQHRFFYSVRDSEGQEEKFAGAEWADWDQGGRLVFAQNGKIYALSADAIGQEPPQELTDLNGNKFEAVEAPEWARHW